MKFEAFEGTKSHEWSYFENKVDQKRKTTLCKQWTVFTKHHNRKSAIADFLKVNLDSGIQKDSGMHKSEDYNPEQLKKLKVKEIKTLKRQYWEL